MGKKKDKKFGAPKPQPTGLPSIHDEDENETMLENSASSAVVANLLEQLKSPEESTRECGCGTLAALASQPGALPILLRNNVVRIVAPLVIDPSPCVRHRALGALRNMTVDGGFDVCHEMVLKDVLTPLIELFKQYGASWEPEKSSTKHTDTRLDIFLQAVHVLWNLCEASDVAVIVFNKEDLLPLLLPCLQHSVYGYPLATAVAQCLHTVTENNTAAGEVCGADSVLPTLKSFVDNMEDTSSQALLFKAAVMGIMLNVLGGEVTSGTTLATFVPLISHILQISGPSLIADYTAKNPEQNGACSMGASGDAQPHTLMEEEVVPRDKEFADILNTLDAQRLCVELVTNMCCSPEEEWEEVDSSESGSSDEMTGDVEMDQEMTVDNNNFNPLCASSDVQDCFSTNNIMAKVSALSLSLPEELAAVVTSRKWGKTICKKHTQLRTSALLCINNLLEAVPAAPGEDPQDLHRLWDTLTQPITTTGADGNPAPSLQLTADRHLLEATTSAMRAVIQKLALLGSPKFSDVTPADVRVLVRLAEGATSTSSAQINVARIVATLAQMLAKSDPTHAVVQEVGGVLLGAATHSADLLVVAEALDCLFDVFADDATHPVALSLQLTQKLKELLPQLKARLQSQKKSLGDGYSTVATARTNLLRFVKYKETQGCR